MDKYNEIANRVSNNILKIRKEKKLTQEEFGKIINVSQSTISDYENGEKLTISILCKIAEKFDMEFEDLFLPIDISNDNSQFPISKLLNRTYFCYYCKNNKIKCFEIKIHQIIDSHNANVIIKENNSKRHYKGTISLNNIFSLVIVKAFEKNRHYVLSFDYYHDSSSDIYIGGLAVLSTTNTYHNHIYTKLCAISINAIGSNKHKELKKILLSDKSIISKSTFGVTNSFDKEYYNWLKENYNL